MFSKLFSKKILLVTGKGGIGKTHVATSLGIAAAKAGKKTILVESNIEDQIGPLLGLSEVGHEVKFACKNLAVINLDPNKNFRDFIVMHLGYAKIFEQIFTKPLVQSFVRMIPGIAEITLLGRLFFHANLDMEHQFDLVIFDGFASGHFKGLMSTPDAILNAGFVGPIINETRRVREYLSDHQKAAIVMVGSPEDLVLSETKEFINDLRSTCSVNIGSVVINRCLEDLDKHQDFVAYQKDDVKDSLKPAIEYLTSRFEKHRSNIQRFIADLDPTTRKHLYLLSERFYIKEPLQETETLAWLNGARSMSPAADN